MDNPSGVPITDMDLLVAMQDVLTEPNR
jgi:hypothetical protein